MTSPCLDHVFIAHVILAVFSGINILFGGWLAHRRMRADSERRRFYTQMRMVHSLEPESDDDVVDRVELRRRP